MNKLLTSAKQTNYSHQQNKQTTHISKTNKLLTSAKQTNYSHQQKNEN